MRIHASHIHCLKTLFCSAEPHTGRQIHLCPLWLSLKSSSSIKKGAKKRDQREHLENNTRMSGLWSFLALSGSLSKVRQCGSKKWIQLWGPFSNTGSLERRALSSERPKYSWEFSVAENWAPLIFSCSHNRSHPLKSQQPSSKKKNIYMFIYIWTQKKLIYKVYTSVHTQFSMGRALPQRKEGQGSDCPHQVPWLLAEAPVKPVFSVLLQSSEAGHMAPAMRRLFPLGAVMLLSTQPRRHFLLGLFRF